MRALPQAYGMCHYGGNRTHAIKKQTMKKITTPICDFVRNYNESKTTRMHMPGHKGAGILGVEALDITEISGADSLYEANGIIKESEDIASTLFGAHTFYSTK